MCTCGLHSLQWGRYSHLRCVIVGRVWTQRLYGCAAFEWWRVGAFQGFDPATCNQNTNAKQLKAESEKLFSLLVQGFLWSRLTPLLQPQAGNRLATLWKILLKRIL